MSKENTYSLATANVLDAATIRPAIAWRIADHVDFAKYSGYNGVELWPQGVIRMQIDFGLISEREKQGITSAHQSVGVSFGTAIKMKSKRELQKSVFLPEKNASLKHLDRLRSIVGDIPVVLFENLPERYLEDSAFTTKGIQTKPETCSEIGVTNAEEFLEAVLGMGYTNVVIDTHHIRHPNVQTGEENPLRNWQESIPVFLPYTNEIHVGLGRGDFGKMDERVIRNELWDFMNGGRNNTEVVRMLRSVADSGWKGLVVLELRPTAIKEILEQRGFQLSRINYQTSLEGMRETLYQIFDK